MRLLNWLSCAGTLKSLHFKKSYYPNTFTRSLYRYNSCKANTSLRTFSSETSNILPNIKNLDYKTMQLDSSCIEKINADFFNYSMEIIKPNSISGLHFAAYTVSGFDKFPEIVYMRNPKGKLYTIDFLSGYSCSESGYVMKKFDLELISKKTAESLSATKGEFWRVVLRLISEVPLGSETLYPPFENSKVFDINFGEYLDRDIWKLIKSYTRAYNIFSEIPEPQVTYRKQLFTRFPYLLLEMNPVTSCKDYRASLAEINKQYEFLKAIDNGEPLIDSINEFFKNKGYILSKSLIKKTAGIDDLRFSPLTFIITSNSLRKKEFSPKNVTALQTELGGSEAGLNKSEECSSFLKQFERFTQFNLPYHEKSPAEFDAMLRLNHILKNTIADEQVRLNLLMHPRKSWQDEYNRYKDVPTEPLNQAIRDTFNSFMKHVILPNIPFELLKDYSAIAYDAQIQTNFRTILLRIITQQMNFGRLLKLSEWWHANQEHINKILSPLANKISWPKLSNDVITPNGYKIISINTDAALNEEGRIMEHCVSSYKEDCALGMKHILSIQTNMDVHVSTVEVMIVNRELIVKQHRANRNSMPSAEAEDALAWYLEQVKFKAIKIYFDEIEAHRRTYVSPILNCSHEERIQRKTFNGIVGFDIADEPLKQRAFELYHPEFIKDKSIKTAKDYMEKFNIIELLNQSRKEVLDEIKSRMTLKNV